MSRYLFYCVCALLLVASILLSFPSVSQAGTTPPETNIILNGIMGGGGWYVSTVDVTMRASDLESGPASTTYTLNSLSPVEVEYATENNALINPSFEDGWLLGIDHWQPVYAELSLLYQAGTGFSGYRSAAIISFGGQYQYWTNRNNYVPVVAGRSYSVSTWVKTFNITQAPGAWFEVWALDSSGNNSDIKLKESPKIAHELDWTLIGLDFTIPANYDGVYVKLGSQSTAGITWYDSVSMHTGNDASTQVLIHQNGQNRLTYNSVDNNGNIEPTKTRYPIKIDTVSPQDWSEFRWDITGNNHTYTAYVDVRDITSGVVPQSAQYRWYDESNCNCWGSWMDVDSIVRTDNGGAVSAGYTGFVTLKTRSTNMGNSGIHTLPKVQFRINDVASALAMSPEYSLFGPWTTIRGGGDIFVNGRLNGFGPTPEDEYAAYGVVAAREGAYGIKSYYDWLVQPYEHQSIPIATLADLIPKYEHLRSRAQELPSNRLPTSSGVYYFSGNYTIDRNALPAGFTSNAISAAIIIEGNLYINQDVALHQDSAVAFLVEGDVIYSPNVGQSQGFLIAAGDINTNSTNSNSGKGDGSLTHTGAFIAGQDIILGRNLGKNKNDQPAEVINFPVKYLVNPGFAGLFSRPDTSMVWQEVGLE